MCLMPIGDDNSDRQSFPFVTVALIAINVLVFVLFQGLGNNDSFTYAFSCVPAEIVSGRDIVSQDTAFVDPQTGRVVIDPSTQKPAVMPGLRPTPISVYITLFTSMFMHGGFAHLFGNMLFLWIFGDNVEDDLGKPRYIAYYLLCGLLASLAHVALNAQSQIPSLGASGAISGVLGGYLLLHPQRRVNVIVLRMMTVVPAWVAIGMWFAFQIINGLGMLGGKGDGVAYGAHIGGFVAGMALAPVFMLGRPRNGAVAARGNWTEDRASRSQFDL